MILDADFGPNSDSFPSLPEIRSDAIRLQVFTHRSFFARPTHVFEDDASELSPDNERYEHLGDTVLGLVVTALMIEMYPGLRVGPATKVRALVVGNNTLAEISVRYRLPDRLRLHPAQALALRTSLHIQADVFESFVGGLFLDQGLETVNHWLTDLFRPYLAAAYRLVRTQHGLPPLPPPVATNSVVPTPNAPATFEGTSSGHLALFNQHLQKSNREVEWIYDTVNPRDPKVDSEVARGARATPIWFVKVVVDGEDFGRGKGNTKKAARNEAAKEGLKKLGIDV